jgi:hypothetical protein
MEDSMSKKDGMRVCCLRLRSIASAVRRFGLTGLLACSALTAACGASDEEDSFTDCALGELTGTWRFRYAETDGNCGPLPDETAVFDPSAPLPAGCTRHSTAVAANKCRMDLAWECPTTDRAGTQAWVLVVHQKSHTKLEGTATVQVVHPTLGTCRSTYALTITKL